MIDVRQMCAALEFAPDGEDAGKGPHGLSIAGGLPITWPTDSVVAGDQLAVI
jgi:hypothetical protein